MQKMTLDELRQYVETMPEGVIVIVEFEGMDESNDRN